MGVLEMMSRWFEFFVEELSTISENAPWADDEQVVAKIQQLNMDLEFLWKFGSYCLETWDEQSRNRLRSTFTAFRVLWNLDSIGLVRYRAETWPVDVQAFHSLAFEIEVRIQRSKLLFEKWSEYLVRSSTQLKSLPDHDEVTLRTFLDILHTLSGRDPPLFDPSFPPVFGDAANYKPPDTYTLSLINSLFSVEITPPPQKVRKGGVRKGEDLSIQANIVPFKNQIDILIDKVTFLYGLFSELEKLESSETLLLFRNLKLDLLRNAMHMACLYWVKEADGEVATEMNILLFNMSHKFISYAHDFSILISENFRALSNSNTLLAIVSGFVDFFFKHLDDDFLIHSDPLTLLFTSLSDAPRESAEAEEDELHSQMYAIFHEHLLSFFEIKEVLSKSNKKIILSDFKTHIKIANAKIRQLYYGRFSDSFISLEAEKMDYIYFVSVSRELYLIEQYDKWNDLVKKSQLRLYRTELRFLRVFLLCFATWDNEEIRTKSSSMITSLQRIWQKEEEKGLLATRLHAIRHGDAADWHPLANELKGNIQLSKLEMKARCVNLSHRSFQFKSSTSYKIVGFMDSILNILNEIVTNKADEIVPFKKQINTLEEKLVFLKNFLKLTLNCVDNKELREFKMFVQAFANDAACLTFLFWAKDADGKIASEVDLMLSHILQKINPVTCDIVRLYFTTLTAIYLQQCDSFLFGQSASIFVDLFIQNLVAHFKDDFQILHDEVIFLLTFLNDPPNGNVEELLCSHIDNTFWEDVYGFLPFDDMEGDFVKKKMLLSDFIMKIGTVNAKIRHLYSKFPESSLYNFPKVISPLFLDFIVQNLGTLKKRMITDRNYVPFAKYKIIKMEEELVYFLPFYNFISDLQSELNDTWSEVVNLIYLTEHFINLCIGSWFVFDHPIWYHMANLSDVIDRIKVVKIKLEKIKENTMYNATCLPRSPSFISTHPEKGRPSKINEIVVGFKDELEEIIGKLTCQHKSLDIVSIVGMGGLGKTTLAKRVYGSATVKCNFDVFAFCYVSQDHNTKRLLMDILYDIKRDEDGISNMTEDDLAHQLWKCLSRQKYLIVLDDIWDESSWYKINRSFPDDKNGSRVMFTTRSRKVAEKCEINSSPHHLRFMSEVESWELMQMKVFHDGISPSNLNKIGRIIVKNCKGVPLAVAVIAGLLARTEKSLTWWSEVAENVVSYLYDEGCMKILELSYKHLPEILKPCFLYLAAFPEDMLIGVKKVILLWIAEGFIQESKTKSLDNVAKDYVHDLADRNLIIVSERGSDAGIKRIRVHDLIHDLCQMKCRDGNFFQLNHGIASSSSSYSSINNHCRVSIRKESDVTVVGGPSILNARSLLNFSEQYGNGLFGFAFNKFRLAQVLAFDSIGVDLKQLGSLVHLRHLDAKFQLKPICIPSSICNFWNIGSLILEGEDIHFPDFFWKMKSLRHVEVKRFILKFSDGHEHEAYPKLDKVVSFSDPILSSVKDVQRLLQRLPAGRKLRCCIENLSGNDEEITLDFHRKIESLNLRCISWRPCLLNNNFPLNLKKLTLENFQLPWTVITTLAKLHCLHVLKLKQIFFPEPILEMEDVVFQNLKFFELQCYELAEWNATSESLPCVEQLVIDCENLEELPPCFGEISTLKRIVVKYCRKVIQCSALRIKEEQMELGIEVEVSIINYSFIKQVDIEAN